MISDAETPRDFEANSSRILSVKYRFVVPCEMLFNRNYFLSYFHCKKKRHYINTSIYWTICVIKCIKCSLERLKGVQLRHSLQCSATSTIASFEDRRCMSQLKCRAGANGHFNTGNSHSKCRGISRDLLYHLEWRHLVTSRLHETIDTIRNLDDDNVWIVFSAVPADGLVPPGARTSAGTVMTKFGAL